MNKQEYEPISNTSPGPGLIFKTRSADKRSILSEEIQNNNSPIPASLRQILDANTSEFYVLDQNFKNLENPLSYVRSKKIQNLIDSTEATSKMMHLQMDSILEFSKMNYKKVVSRDYTQYDFSNHVQNMLKPNNFPKTPQNSKSKAHKQRKQSFVNNPQSIKLQKFAKFERRKIKENQNPGLQQFENIGNSQNSIQQESQTSSINFSHIKILDTAEFESKCKQIQFYDWLRPQKLEKYKLENQQFNIDNNSLLQRRMFTLSHFPIQDSIELGSASKQLFFDFQENFKFWRPKKTKKAEINSDHQNELKQFEEVMSFCSLIQKKQINVLNIFDITMRKITPDMLKDYFRIKREHMHKLIQDKRDENIDQMYNDLKKEYEYTRQLRIKMKNQKIPVKHIETQSQTMHKMEQKQFDSYFAEDINLIMQRLHKLNQLRERTMVSVKQEQKITVLKNICLDIKEVLFKLLTMMLKGEKFYANKTNSQLTKQARITKQASLKKQAKPTKQTKLTKQVKRTNNTKIAPYFSYIDLINTQNREQVEAQILELIYTKINQFEVQQVDHIPKEYIIKVYAQQRQKNTKILQILNGE